jgi:hypothetical protein
MILVKIVVKEKVLHSGVKLIFHSLQDILIFFEFRGKENNNLIITVQLRCISSGIFIQFMLVSEGNQLYSKLLGLKVGLHHIRN